MAVVGTGFVAEYGLQLRHVELAPGAIDQPLEHGIEGGSTGEQEIAAVLDLVGGVAIAEMRPLLLLEIQREAETAGVYPTVTDLGKSPYGVLVAQGLCELIQGLERATHEAVTLLADGDSLPAGLALDPFVTVEHDLNPEGRMATHLDGDVAPVGINEMEVVMINEGPRGLALQVGDTVGAVLDLPDQAWCLGYEDEKQSSKVCRVCARESRRVDPSPTGLAQGDNLFVPGFVLRSLPRPTPLRCAGRDSAHTDLTACGMRFASCLRGCGSSPLRHCGSTHAPTPTRDYAPSLRSPWRAAMVLKLTAMTLQLACRCVEVEFLQFPDPADLEQSEVLAQGVARNAREPTNLLVFKTLTLQPENLHAPTHPRVCMRVTQLLKLFQIRR